MTTPRPALTVTFIQDTVAQWFRIPKDMLRSERRAVRFARPRQVAMWMTVKLMPLRSLPRIGRDFDRDHTTVLHAISMVEKRRQDLDYATDLDFLRELILTTAVRPASDEELALQLAEDVSEAFRRAVQAMARTDPARFIRNAGALAGIDPDLIEVVSPCAS